MSFAKWNQRLLDQFFGEFAAGKQVRLAISRELLDQEFSDLGGTQGFIQAVLHGPDWPVWYVGGQLRRPLNILRRALGLHLQWQRAYPRCEGYVMPEHDAPPHLPYLCLFAYAWTIEGAGFAGNDFYGRLASIYPQHGLEQSLGDLDGLWHDLELWTNANDARFGKFIVEQLGEMQHVGIPKSQVIFTAARIARLPRLFQSLGLIPGDELTESQLRGRMLANQSIVGQLLGEEIWS